MVDHETGGGVTVGAAADLVNVTVRTLHHWDEIGLASPSGRSPAGYRLYTEPDLDRLHRVVAYRETGLGLDAIRTVLDDATTEITATLREQRAHLAERIHDLHLLDERLSRMTEAHEHGILLTVDEQRETFGKDWNPDHTRLARVAWGDTPQWARFAERSAARTRPQWQSLADAMHALQADLATALTAGTLPGTPTANDLVDRHRELFSNFFPLTRQMQVCLGRLFESDPGFAAHYNGVADGLATWFRQIIDESARANGIDPDTATWR